jgi:glycosyltransferase involved in cell wall biosynthesis
VMEERRSLPVIHIVNAMNGSRNELWGKERVIAALMRAQYESGEVVPSLITFSPCRLADLLYSQGFPVKVLSTGHRRVPVDAILKLRRWMESSPPAVVHTHGYKANIVGRAVRASGARMRGLVSTCHGWIDETSRTRLYNRIDRATAFASDIVTVTDEAMLSHFPQSARRTYVPNGIDYRSKPTNAQRLAARQYFRLPQDRVLVGMLGRTDEAKGVFDLLEAARQTLSLPLHWVIAGSGPLDDAIRNAKLPNVTFLGYVHESDCYLDALNLYLQASHREGLSLSLLEAMRAGLPIVATRVGSTAAAVRHMGEALLIAPGDVDAIISAIRQFIADSALAEQAASAARRRFESAFQVRHQHEAFLRIYRSCDRMCS